MSSNIREFQIGVKAFAKENVPEAVRDFRDAVALEGLNGLVMLTPVDTGRARGNWQTTVGAPAEGYAENKFDPSGAATIADGAGVIATAADPFASVWLHSGVPYIRFLNDGTDKIPAVHMLEQTVQRLVRTFSHWKGAK